MGRVCSFTCLRWALVLLNVFYTTIGLVLVGVVIATKALAFFSEPHILIGTAVCGSILVLIAVFGLVGAVKHHQIILFFYMVILGVSTVLMFSVSVAVLAAPATLQKTVLLQTWKSLDDNDKTSIQNALNCCGFSNGTQNNSFLDKTVAHPTCNTTVLNAEDMCCSNSNAAVRRDTLASMSQSGTDSQCPDCNPCYSDWKEAIDKTFRIAGAFGLVFSFTQIAGIIVTYRYRNEKDPMINPNSFL